MTTERCGFGDGTGCNDYLGHPGEHTIVLTGGFLREATDNDTQFGEPLLEGFTIYEMLNDLIARYETAGDKVASRVLISVRAGTEWHLLHGLAPDVAKPTP